MGVLSGRLRLIQHGCERRYDFLRGEVVFVSSSHPDERLATWLARRGAAPAELLQRLLVYSLVHRELFTSLLLKNDQVEVGCLREAIVELAKHVTTRVLVDPEAEFSFDPSFPVQDPLGLEVHLEPNQLMLEASRRHDEQQDSFVPPVAVMLPFSGEAYDQFFWDLIRQGISGPAALDGEGLAGLYQLVRDAMGTLSQWLATSPGLVPLPSPQVEELAHAVADGVTPELEGRPQLVWNQMVLACSMRSSRLHRPLSLAELSAFGDRQEAWWELATGDAWHRPQSSQIDALTASVSTELARAARAAAEPLQVDPDLAELAAHLLTVPTDLVLYVLATLPIPIPELRVTLLELLARRLAASLASTADFPPEILELFPADGSPAPTALNACLYLAREATPRGQLLPAPLSEDSTAMIDVAPAEVIGRAARAAQEVVGMSLAVET